MMSRKQLVTYAVIALGLMIPLSIRAINERGVFDNEALMADVWFQVTLLDAYLAFLAVWVFVCRIEKTALAKTLWLIGILCFGSMAIAAYMLKLAAESSGQNSEMSEVTGVERG